MNFEVRIEGGVDASHTSEIAGAKILKQLKSTVVGADPGKQREMKDENRR